MSAPSAPLELIVGRIASAQATAPVVLVGIGGHGGAGKSTLATTIAAVVPHTQVVATDSFWDGSGFDLQRLRQAVLDPLLAGTAVAYDEWDWAGKRLRPGREVHPGGVVIVEGVCALHQMFRADLAVRVWVDAPYDVRLERGVARDGEDARSTWVDVWMPNEEAYVRRDDPVACAHLVVDGTRPFA